MSRATEKLQKSTSKLKTNLQRAKFGWTVRWPEENECCKIKGKELIDITIKLDESCRRFAKENDDKKNLNAQLEKSNQQNTAYSKDLDMVKQQLKDLQQQNEKQTAEMELLKSASSATRLELSSVDAYSLSTTTIRKDTEGATDSLNTHENSLEANSKSEMHKLRRMILQLEAKVVELMPLTSVGLAIRSRKYELDMKKLDPDQPTYWNIVEKGNEAAHCGQATADATMCLSFRMNSGYSEKEFMLQYNQVPPAVVLQYRDFGMFQNILNLHMNMRQWAHIRDQERFMANFDIVFPRIFPKFEINCDAGVTQDRELAIAYEILVSEAAATEARAKEWRRSL